MVHVFFFSLFYSVYFTLTVVWVRNVTIVVCLYAVIPRNLACVCNILYLLMCVQRCLLYSSIFLFSQYDLFQRWYFQFISILLHYPFVFVLLYAITCTFSRIGLPLIRFSVFFKLCMFVYQHLNVLLLSVINVIVFVHLHPLISNWTKSRPVYTCSLISTFSQVYMLPTSWWGI